MLRYRLPLFPIPDILLTHTATYLELERSLLPKDIQQRIIELLTNNNGCKLPCFWGITPGSTSWDDARTFLQEFNRIYSQDEQFRDGPYREYSVNLTVADLKSGFQFPLTISVGDNTVQRMYILVISGDGFSFKDYWFNYSLDNLFKTLGKPDVAYLGFVEHQADRGYGLRLLYLESKIAVIYSLFPKTNYEICPNFLYGDEMELLGVSLLYPESTLDILPRTWRHVLEDDDYWRTIQQELGIDEEEFYNQMLSDPRTCFALNSEALP